MLNFNSRLKSVVELFILSLTVFTFFRFLFYVLFHGKAESFSSDDLRRAFILGLRFDVRIAAALVLPAILFSIPRAACWSLNPKAKVFWMRFYTSIYFLIGMIYILDLGHYEYLESRVSSSVFENLRNPLISAQMIWETYSIIPLCVALFFFVLIVYSLLKHRIFIYRPFPKRTLLGILVWLLVVPLVILGIHGSLGQYPLRWSEAFFSQNNFVSNLAMNPIHYIFDTMGRSQSNFDLVQTKKYYPIVANYLGVKELDPEKLNFQRPLENNLQFTTAPNIVYIVMESMAAFKTGAFGNPSGASPALDELAKGGWLFRNFYTPAEGTARSLFCILSGVPDLDAKSTSSRNPLIINQHTLINALKDYEKFYFIGGSANWGNIRGVYTNNVKNLVMYEEENLGGKSADVWGLSDLELFKRTAEILKTHDSKKPFFALIQSASYHRPYTIPADHGDFELKTMSPEQLAKSGFASNEEFNSFRLADYSLGQFFKWIKTEPFYKNTIFVIHGDHGLPHEGAQNISEGYKHFGLNRFHTPLVVYSPLITLAKEESTMMMEPDALATVIGQLGLNYTNTSLGQNVFAVAKGKSRYAFSYVYYTQPLQIMLYDSEYIVVGTAEHGPESMHQYNTADFKTDVKTKYPEKYKEMADLLMGIFETSRYMVYNNKRLKDD